MPKSDSGRSRVSAAEVLAPVLAAQVTDLRAWEVGVRLAQPEATHGFRVAARRLRSMLAAFGPLMDQEAADELAEQLKRAAGAIGGARDSEIVQARVEALLGEEADDLDVAGTRERLSRRLEESYEASRQASIEHLDSPEYDAFVRHLEAFVDLPAWTDAARGRAEKVLRPLLRAEWSRFRKRTQRALTGTPGPEQDVRMHDARKSAKRARYVAESLVPLFGRRARRLGKAAERVQVVLGDHQDCVLTQRVLREVGEQAFRDGENPFLLGRLQAREAAAAADLRADFTRVAAAADRPSLRRWLD
ncbi:CHAD domain-containing protein [Nocardioides panacis]|uniref:CHAD domain-containing protein n=1 Tax=Nocardioides panacis TaxID=2849501 RepID=A0A975Y0S2_9ACTN|nr:CHAD domain-containing protein [Nocardioides panacis]QWZ08783.1 CHAD domain-containing protein [Nocardioides panacis]